MSARCLYCYKELSESEKDFHGSCSRKFFGSAIAPVLPYTKSEIKELAKQVIASHTTIAGVQPKLSLNIRKKTNEDSRLTIVGLWGDYILKPQTEKFPFLPENEDLTMHLAEIAKIKTVPHSLIKFADGELCYITKRIDRLKNGEKIAMEDMCQITERLSEDKYKSSYEQIAKMINLYSSTAGFDIVNFAEIVLFSWLTGNADMHLKNFSLYMPKDEYLMSPCYDLLNSTLALPSDKEELALNLNGKKRKLKKSDFEIAFTNFGMNPKSIENLFNKMKSIKTDLFDFIALSFLPAKVQKNYFEILKERYSRFFK